MRDPVSVLYYPDMMPEELTLKKAVLFFDEIHLMDRPSFTFEGGLGTIGTQSPLRRFEQSFRDEGVPLYVHEAPRGPVHGAFLDMVTADVNDPVFLEKFQGGLKSSKIFSQHQVQGGQYADIDTKEQHSANDVRERFRAIELAGVLASFESPMALLTDKNVGPYRFTKPESIAKTLVFQSAVTSSKLNHALTLGASEGFVPFADAVPYGDLLHTKYARAIAKLDPGNSRIPVTDLSFAIFDSLVDQEVLANIHMVDVIRYRKESASAREAFLEYLSALQLKACSVSADQTYDDVIQKLVVSEIIPAARQFQNKIQSIFETALGSLAKGAVEGVAGGTGIAHLFGDLSLEKILAIGSLVVPYLAKTGIDAYLAARAARRECALTYVLSIENVLS